MDTNASGAIAEEMLQGFFSVLERLLSASFSRQAEGVSAPTDGDVSGFLDGHPCVMRAMLGSGAGVAILISAGDGSRMASLVLGEAPMAKATLDANDLAALQEVAEPCLSGGISHVMEAFARPSEQPQEVHVATMRPEDGAALAASLSLPIAAVPFTFSATSGFDGSGVLLFSQHLEDLAVADVSGVTNGGRDDASSAQPRLSDEEMSDILSGFGADAAGSAGGNGPTTPTAAPPNLDMVLDLNLVVTARLGRVEMPIGDILSLGPGSIIQVGHLVDEPIELLVNDRLVARGDVVVVDEKFGLRITEIVSAKERIESLH